MQEAVVDEHRREQPPALAGALTAPVPNSMPPNTATLAARSRPVTIGTRARARSAT
jgi:hypothetical protein